MRRHGPDWRLHSPGFKDRPFLSTLYSIFKGVPPSAGGKVYSFLTTAWILTAAILYILENSRRLNGLSGEDYEGLPIWPKYTIAWYIIESLMIVYFTVDLGMRFFLCIRKDKFLKCKLVSDC